MTTKTDSLIDLVKFSTSVLDNPTIKQKLSENIPIVLTGKNLLGKLPDLKPLENLPLIQVKNSKNGLPIVLLPTIYLDDKNLIVCLPDLNVSITDKLLIKSVSITEIDNYAIITDIKETVFLKVKLGLQNEAISQLLIEDGPLGLIPIENFDLDKYRYLFKQRPSIELSLSLLKKKTDYEILSIGEKISKKHNTVLMTVKNLKTGKIFENVLTNSDIERNGSVNSIFQIIDSKEFKTTKKDGKKDVSTIQVKHFIKWNGLDLSDLKL